MRRFWGAHDRVYPPIAIAIWLAVAVYVPAARLQLVIAAAGLAWISVAAIGAGENVEYVQAVLPAQAASSVAESTQYSATHVAWILGAAPPLALAIGKLWALVATAVGIWMAGRLRAAYGVATLILIPAAFAAVGGLYAHFQHVALAFPGILLVGTGGSRRAPGFVSIAILIATLPWMQLAVFPPFAFALVGISVIFLSRGRALKAIEPEHRHWMCSSGMGRIRRCFSGGSSPSFEAVYRRDRRQSAGSRVMEPLRGVERSRSALGCNSSPGSNDTCNGPLGGVLNLKVARWSIAVNSQDDVSGVDGKTNA